MPGMDVIEAPFRSAVDVMASDNDAGGLSVYGQAGQNHGLRLAWILVLLAPVLLVNQEMAARLGAVTGAGHARLIVERFGRTWGSFALGDLVVLNLLTIVTEFIGVTLALGYPTAPVGQRSRLGGAGLAAGICLRGAAPTRRKPPRVALRLVEQRRDVLVGQCVHALATAPLGDDQTVIAKQPELMGHRGLSHSGGGDQLADRVRPFPQAPEDPHAAGGREREHRVGDPLGEVLGHYAPGSVSPAANASLRSRHPDMYLCAYSRCDRSPLSRRPT
jgi:Natural resistance-associated macrophage protein-like